MTKVSNERKNLNRLAGEFLVASQLTQRGYMITLQWGNTIGYDILVFDKSGNVAFLEVKSTAAYSKQWIVQKKYAHPGEDAIPLKKRFVCCVDLAVVGKAPEVYVFPADIVAKGLHYYFKDKFPNAESFRLSLNSKPQYRTKTPGIQTVGEHIRAESYLDNYSMLGVKPLTD